MAAEVMAEFAARFEWALDLRDLDLPRPIIARAGYCAPNWLPESALARRMVVLIPTEQFRTHQIATLPRAGRLGNRVSDPALGQRNRLARDRLVAQDAARSAARHGIPVIEVDGTCDADGTADLVATGLGLP